MEQAKNSLKIKRKVIEQLTGQGLYPYLEFYLRHLLKRTAATFSDKVHITTFQKRQIFISRKAVICC